jgi:hypothetical protein
MTSNPNPTSAGKAAVWSRLRPATVSRSSITVLRSSVPVWAPSSSSVGNALYSTSAGGRRKEGGVIRLLKRNVPYLRNVKLDILVKEKYTYTRRLNPVTCNNDQGHTSTSQPSPRLTIQIVIVLHVSMILRIVALIWRVILKPKKL